MLYRVIVPVLALLALRANALYHKDVTASTFDQLLDPSKAHVLVEFYAPWCGHCQNLAPEYERLGETFSSSQDVVIAQVDADKHKSLAKKYGVSGFPTLKWVQKGSTFDKAEDVNAERTADGLLSYVNGKTGLTKKLKGAAPSSVTDVSEDNFDSIKSDEGVHALIGFFAPWCGHCKAIKPTWEDLAKLYTDESDVVIGAVNCDDNKGLCEREGVQGFPTIKYFNGGSSENFDQGRSLEELVKYVNTKSGHDLTSEGGVTESAGVIDELSEHVGSFLSAGDDKDRTNAINVCKEKVDALGDHKAGKHFEYYIKVFAKVMEKGADYVKTEKERLQKILDGGSTLKSSQRRSFMRRINVLSVFQKTK